MNKLSRVVFNVVLALLIVDCRAADAQQLTRYGALMERLSEIQLTLEGEEAEQALAALRVEAVTNRDANPGEAEAWIASARVGAMYARTQGMGGLGLAKDVKAEFEKSMELDPAAQQGMAQGYLGQVYLVVPGWPVGFGNEKKGVQMMEQALSAYPGNGLINLLYAQHLIGEERYKEAQQYLDQGSAIIDADLAHPLFRQLQQRNIENFRKALSSKSSD